MSDCCGSTCESKSRALKQECPVCHHAGVEVSKRTMLHHVRDVWNYDFSEQRYYFCQAGDCDVIYFAENGELLTRADIRTRVGIKEEDENTLICYCFGVSKAAALIKEVKDFVVKQTKNAICACETANPSGRCCLKDFPKIEK